jgi:hypothetical protein
MRPNVGVDVRAIYAPRPGIPNSMMAAGNRNMVGPGGRIGAAGAGRVGAAGRGMLTPTCMPLASHTSVPTAPQGSLSNQVCVCACVRVCVCARLCVSGSWSNQVPCAGKGEHSERERTARELVCRLCRRSFSIPCFSGV